MTGITPNNRVIPVIFVFLLYYSKNIFKGELSSWNIWLQCLATGLVFVLLDLIFDWITKSNNGSLKTMIFSNDTLWTLAFGMAMGAIFLRKKKGIN